MSSALAAARKRRVNTEPLPPAPTYGQNSQQQTPVYNPNIQSTYGQNMQRTNTPVSQNMPNNGLTLQQVISLIDKRLITLEEYVKEQSEMEPLPPLEDAKNASNLDSIVEELNAKYSDLDSIVEEFNSRYNILAQEIDTMKDMMLKLQSFTMEVNKALMDERVRIFSDIDNINSSLEMKKTLNFDKSDSIHGFSQKMDYLEQTGEFNIENELAKN